MERRREPTLCNTSKNDAVSKRFTFLIQYVRRNDTYVKVDRREAAAGAGAGLYLHGFN